MPLAHSPLRLRTRCEDSHPSSVEVSLCRAYTHAHAHTYRNIYYISVCTYAVADLPKKAIRLIESIVGRRDPAPLRLAETLAGGPAALNDSPGLAPARREVLRWVLATGVKQMSLVATRVRERLANPSAPVSTAYV
jgi:hypothetical protein